MFKNFLLEKHFVRLWHFTWFESALEIIKNNLFELEINDWPEDEEKKYVNGEWLDRYNKITNSPNYMLCTTRIKNSYVGYSSEFLKRFDEKNISFARIELNEDTLENSNLIVRSESDCVANLHINDFKNNKEDYNINWQFLHEDRILSKFKTIHNAAKYIRRIDFLTNNDNDILKIQELKNNIIEFKDKIFIYNNTNDFNFKNITLNESLNINDIPIDAGLSENPEIHKSNKIYKYNYFGNCKNTVLRGIWDATQMSNFLQGCEIIPINNVINLLFNGDDNLPTNFLKEIEKLKRDNKLEDLSEICAGIDEYQKIMFIYITSLDYHFFFDCNALNLPKYLYHATPSCYIKSIKKLGLGAKFPRKRLWDYKGTKYENINNGIFLANDEYVAYDYVDNSETYEELCDNSENDISIIVFKINVNNLDITKLSIDTNQNVNNIKDCTYFYDGIIPYDKLEKIEINECLSYKYIHSLNENLNMLNGFYKYENWQELQKDVNTIGWENFVLYNPYKRNHAWKQKSTGHYIMNMQDPREDAIYYGWLVNGKPLAITNIYLYSEEIWIGDFEVSKFHKDEGLGRLLFNALKNKYPNMNFALTYRDENAKQFWMKMGFKYAGHGHVMIYECKK